jgi:hypothetical protein
VINGRHAWSNSLKSTENFRVHIIVEHTPFSEAIAHVL